MGWINQGQLRQPRPKSPNRRTLQNQELNASTTTTSRVNRKGSDDDNAVSSSFIEDRDLHFPFCPKNLPDSELPLIPAEVVAQHNDAKSSRLWIVVDEIVYDCSAWADEHPGGDSVIHSFGGQDCSWQFWRFHSKKDMAKYGVSLRVGRTQGVMNRYPEPKRYSRLRGFDAEDW